MRRSLLETVEGEVVEIGFGSGLNLPFYPRTVSRILAVEPVRAARKLAGGRIASSPVPVHFVGDRAEALGVGSRSVDAVVSTWTLCSLPDRPGALGEIRRVLRIGGRFHFLEHGLASDEAVARWQRRLTPIQRIVGGGCRLDFDVDGAVRAAGLRLESLSTFYMKGPRIASFMYQGIAVADG